MSHESPPADVFAELTFLSPEEGGRSSNPAGLHATIRLGDVHTSCTVWPTDGRSVFEPGVPCTVRIAIRFWSEYGHLYDETQPLELYDGSRRIAVG